MTPDCNSCTHHLQGRTVNDCPSICWSCFDHSEDPLVLRNWTPKPGTHIPTAMEAVVSQVLVSAHVGDAPAASTQVGGDHYKDFAIQPLHFAMVNGLNPCQAKVIKYVTRRKGDLTKQLEDLDKATHVIQIYRQLLVDGALPANA